MQKVNTEQKEKPDTCRQNRNTQQYTCRSTEGRRNTHRKKRDDVHRKCTERKQKSARKHKGDRAVSTHVNTVAEKTRYTATHAQEKRQKNRAEKEQQKRRERGSREGKTEKQEKKKKNLRTVTEKRGPKNVITEKERPKVVRKRLRRKELTCWKKDRRNQDRNAENRARKNIRGEEKETEESSKNRDKRGGDGGASFFLEKLRGRRSYSGWRKPRRRGPKDVKQGLKEKEPFWQAEETDGEERELEKTETVIHKQKK
ncbi:vicilin-like seed storage protein At2g18540 [Prosopis cineraria]|uniref:vicilin-like seed storage protein At2g18540 n=1 Tax=Prosopis cineraria TaxID=364024 RepID=UPI00241025FC|nr:vicilin-like seed storage protein At2g18540 [Prosopis cineraria]